MSKEIISENQAISLYILFIWGSTLVIGTGGAAKKSMWIAMILGAILTAILIFFYCKILSAYPQMTVFDINNEVFGSFIGRCLNSLYVFFAYTLGTLVLNNFSEFIGSVGLSDTPKPVAVLPIVMLTIWGVKAGIETLGRWSEFFVVVLFVIIMIPTILGIPQMEPNNIRPILREDIGSIINGTFTAFSFPFAESVIFLMVFSCLPNKKSAYKVFYIGLLISGVVLVVISLRNLLIIGSELLAKNYFPTYIVIARINVGDFVQRIEILNTVAFLIAGFIKICLCVLAASNGLATVFKFDSYKTLVTPITLTLFAASFIAYESIVETSQFVPQVYPMFAAIFQVILPMITFIGVKFKNKAGEANG
jgi:spore germination protein KB